MKRINMWSGPRNISTAMMYAFAQRSDTHVVDEPFYAHYLDQSEIEHPVRNKVLARQSTDAADVLDQLLNAGSDKKILFIKNMAHHMIAMDAELAVLMEKCEPVFLIRNPREMLPSLDRKLSRPTLRDTAYKQLYELFEMRKQSGQKCCVIDSHELLKAPHEVLSSLCGCLDISFDEQMLHWEKGGRKEDGIWADYWYDSVHNSTGFMPYRPPSNSFPEHLNSLLTQCKPYYNKMFVHAIKAGC